MIAVKGLWMVLWYLVWLLMSPFVAVALAAQTYVHWCEPEWEPWCDLK